MVNRTFETLWEKLEQAKEDYRLLKLNSKEEEAAATDKEFAELAKIKNSLLEIARRAKSGLSDPWELDQILDEVDSLMLLIDGAMQTPRYVSSK